MQKIKFRKKNVKNKISEFLYFIKFQFFYYFKCKKIILNK